MLTQANQGDSGKQVDDQLSKYREEKDKKWKMSQAVTREEQKQPQQQEIPERYNVIPQSQIQQKLQQQLDPKQQQEKVQSKTSYEVPKQYLQQQPKNQQIKQQERSKSEYIKEENKYQGQKIKCFTCDLMIQADQYQKHALCHKAKPQARSQQNVVQNQKSYGQKIVQREKAIINLNECNICGLCGEVEFIRNHMKDHLNEQQKQPVPKLPSNLPQMIPLNQQTYQHQYQQAQNFQIPQSQSQYSYPQNQISMPQSTYQPIIKRVPTPSYPQSKSMIQQNIQRQQGIGSQVIPQQQQSKTQIYSQQQVQYGQNIISNPQSQQISQSQLVKCDVCNFMIHRDKIQQHYQSHSNEEQKNPIKTPEQLLNAYQNNFTQNFQILQDQAMQSFQQANGQFLNRNNFENQIQASYNQSQPSNQQVFYYQQPQSNNQHQSPQSTYQPKRDIQYPSNNSLYNPNQQQQVQQSQVPWPSNQSIPSKQNPFQQRNSQLTNANMQGNRVMTLDQLKQIKAQPQTAIQQNQALRFQNQYQQQVNQQQPLSEFCDQCQQYIFKQVFEEHQKHHAITQIQQQERRLTAQQEQSDLFRQINLGSQKGNLGREGPFGSHNYESLILLDNERYLVGQGLSKEEIEQKTQTK